MNFHYSHSSPQTYRTSAEDSFGNATFQGLEVSDLEPLFFNALQESVPPTQRPTWDKMMTVLDALKVSWADRINYFLFVNQNDWNLQSWGNGLFLFGLIPDNKLLANMADIDRRVLYNLRCSSILCNFAISAADKVMILPLNPGTIQKDIVKMFASERGVNDNVLLCERIYEKYPNINFGEWKIDKLDNPTDNVVVTAELVPGKDPEKELVRDTMGYYIMQIPSGKKSKLNLK